MYINVFRYLIYMQIKCNNCDDKTYIRKGYRKTEHRGKIQKYLCLSCNHYFTHDEGFYRMRHSPATITKAIDLYFSNLSSRKVRNHYQRHEQEQQSHVTVLDWCRRYAKKVQRYVETLTPQLAGNCYADETDIQVRKEHHRFWVCIDYGTRYINATHYSPTAAMDDAVTFTRKIAQHKPRYVQTDAAMFYPQAMRRAFWKHNKMSVEHRVNNVSKTGKHNVRIETVFSKIKDRVRDMRTLKAVWSAPLLLAGIVIQHNFIEAHTTTGQVPATLSKIGLSTMQNRWLGLIKAST